MATMTRPTQRDIDAALEPWRLAIQDAIAAGAAFGAALARLRAAYEAVDATVGG